MNKTKIEWCDYTINPIKGLCKGGCSYCYARRMYKRFKWNPEIRFGGGGYEFWKLKKIKKPSMIFVGSMHDIFGDWIPNRWIEIIIEEVKTYPQHIFQFLTKNPLRYRNFNFPKNCWLGVTITGEADEGYLSNGKQYAQILIGFEKHNNIKFISVEPLLHNCFDFPLSIDWLIVGGLTPRPIHGEEDVQALIQMARAAEIPIFLKDNLNWPEKIQEFPKAGARE